MSSTIQEEVVAGNSYLAAKIMSAGERDGGWIKLKNPKSNLFLSASSNGRKLTIEPNSMYNNIKFSF